MAQESSLVLLPPASHTFLYIQLDSFLEFSRAQIMVFAIRLMIKYISAHPFGVFDVKWAAVENR